MSSIDEVSSSIGELRAIQRQHGEAHTKIMEKLDLIAAQQATVTAEMPALRNDVNEALESGRDWKKNKNRLIGGGLALSGIFGGIAGNIKDFFQ